MSGLSRQLAGGVLEASYAKQLVLIPRSLTRTVGVGLARCIALVLALMITEW